MANFENTFYECDPFMPGIYPERAATTDFFANPLIVDRATLQADLVSQGGVVLAPAGTTVMELGVAASPHHFHRNLWSMNDNLADLAEGLEAVGAVLRGESPEGVTAKNKEDIHGALPEGMPPLVVAHTRQAVGAVAVRDFGFQLAADAATMPPLYAAAIAATGEAPNTVYMPMEQFLAFTPHDWDC